VYFHFKKYQPEIIERKKNMQKRTKNCVLWEDYLKEESVHLTLRHGTACPAEWWQLDQPHHSIRDASLLT